MWRLLTDHGSVRPAFDGMLERYDVPPDVLERDLLRLVDELREKALLEVRGGM